MNDAQIEAGEKIKGKIIKRGTKSSPEAEPRKQLPRDAAETRIYIIEECGVDEGNTNLPTMLRAYTDLKKNDFRKANEWLKNDNNGKKNSTGKFIELLKNDFKSKYDADSNTFMKKNKKDKDKSGKDVDPDELKKNYLTLQNTLKLDDHADKVIKDSVPKGT